MTLIQTRQDLEDFLSPLLDGDAVQIKSVADGLLDQPHPEYGEDWGAWLDDGRVWLVAHTRQRFKDGGLANFSVETHGRGVRITGPDLFDVVCFSFGEVDKALLDKILS